MKEFIFETLHVISFLVLLILPYITSSSFHKTYGLYISIFISMVITSWVLFKNCPLSTFETNTTKWGSVISYIHNRLHISTKPYTKYIWIIITLLYSISGLLFANDYLRLYILFITTLYFILYTHTI